MSQRPPWEFRWFEREFSKPVSLEDWHRRSRLRVLDVIAIAIVLAPFILLGAFLLF